MSIGIMHNEDTGEISVTLAFLEDGGMLGAAAHVADHLKAANVELTYPKMVRVVMPVGPLGMACIGVMMLYGDNPQEPKVRGVLLGDKATVDAMIEELWP